MIDRVLSPSVHVEVTSKETPHFYDVIVKAKIYGLCGKEIQRFFLENNKLFDVDSNNASHGIPDVLLQTGCPDCIVSKRDRFPQILTIFSRRKNMTAAELKEFETQA
ncbi:hypothetical protein KUCAC02_029890 [Chaenocephalus aceratus]|uniref:Uncharacterized protein n=1 Tax=Chaenocephalus aceratus TaxID=36190 RepID=A0ACB9XIH2_CHAAC|nr:hypothetical protein KUCAC02_029890 [Chaenocephalus aceratus]